MRVLLTGCSGFIGSRVVERLSQNGHQVIGLDNLNDAYDVRLKNWRLARLSALPSFTFAKVDITDRQQLGALFRQHSVDAVVNLAARAGVRQSLANPWVYCETNLIGTLNLVDLCREREIPKFVLASTSSLYAGGARPFREDQNTDQPLSPYAASKKAAELLCHAYHQQFGLDVTVLRYFTVFGPAGRPDMSVFRFIRWIAEEDKVILYGDGSQERDFTYVDDIARGTVSALRPLGYEVINLGSDRPVQLRDVIAILENGLGQTARIDRRPRHPADVQVTWADIGKARSLLGWAPQTTLEDGLANTLSWYKEHRSWASKIDLPA